MIGRTISHYHITERLGGGGMGVVYKAEDTRLKRTVALKFLPPDLTRDEDARERFVQEAQAASALDHVNICTIHEIDETDEGQTFIAMAYYPGQTLKKKIERGPLPVEEAVEVAVQIAEGLARAHEEGIIHRDVKPANVMVTDRGVVKVLDFGLAKVASGAALTQAGRSVGTPLYMSPEQARGEVVDARTDVWSLGVVLYEMLTGVRPFRGDYEQAVIYSILNQDVEPVVALRPEVPEALALVVDRALEKDREARYGSMAEMLEALRAYQASLQPAGAVALDVKRLVRQPRVLIPALIVLLVLGALGVWWINRSARVQWAREEALPEIERLSEGTRKSHELWALFELASEAARYIPDDPLLERLWPTFSRHVGIYSDLPGARVYAKPYGNPDDVWRYLGQTPLDSLRFPLGPSRIKLEREGFSTVYDLAWNAGVFGDLHFMLPEAGRIPEDMVLVPDTSNWYRIAAAPAGLHLPGLEHLGEEPIGDFLIDRHEVTNAAFKRFVESGGYQNPDYWKHAFVKDGQTLSFDKAVAQFVDKTGRPGPATWEVGDYPEGKGDYPVSGVSWYEAAAYAEFVGKSLPTIYHWDRVALTWGSDEIVPLSNLSGAGLVPVGSRQAMNRFGTYDLAGNVREWVWNESSRLGRFILGGGWNDPAYGFNDAFAQSPFDRSETNGFRCMKYLGAEDSRAALEKKIEMPFRDFLSEPQVSDETFALFLNQYAYDKTALNAVVESVEEAEDWTREKITFDAAYGGERMIAYLFLPKQGTPPYQTVIYFPGSGAIHTRSSEEIGGSTWLAKSGRAFLRPIYKSTYERGDGLATDSPSETTFWKDHVIMWAKDLSRSIDYLETRDDIDTDKLAYYGVSWGGDMGAIMPTVEGRIKTSVLVVAGLLHQRALPEVEPIHYLPRLTMPVIMLNGKHDFFFPYETSQVPFYTLLGTPEEDKVLLAYEGGGWGHSVPRTVLIKETLAWLDKYLGPVE